MIEIVGGPHDGKLVEGWADTVWLGHLAGGRIYQCAYEIKGAKAMYIQCLDMGEAGEVLCSES